MKCQILFTGKNKKTIINLSSVELATRVVNLTAPNVIPQLSSAFFFFLTNYQLERSLYVKAERLNVKQRRS